MADQRRKAAKKQRRDKRLAGRARRFEQHAALVTEREGDPRYAQRVENLDGSVTVSAPDEDGELAAALLRQREAFREKFGREIGPDDPVFFDPEADEPVPMNPDTMVSEIRQAAEEMPDAKSRAHLLAYADVGYMVTEANQHLFTAYEVEAYLDAVAEHL